MWFLASLFSETGFFCCFVYPFHVYCLVKTAVEVPKSNSKVHVIYRFFLGTVAIWNLLRESPLLKERMGDGTRTFRECETFCLNKCIVDRSQEKKKCSSGIKHERPCQTTYPNTEERLENTTHSRVFMARLELFGNVFKH